MNPWLQVAVTLGESSLTGAGDSATFWKYIFYYFSFQNNFLALMFRISLAETNFVSVWMIEGFDNNIFIKTN